MNLALILIDVQNVYFGPDGNVPLPGSPAALPNIHRLLETARAKGIHVIHVTHEALDPAARSFRHGTADVEIHPSIQVLPGEDHVVKHYPGSFTETPLESYLRRAGAKTLIVCGFQTQMCCDTTTRQARERGYQVWFASDATAARDMRLGEKVVPHREVHETVLAIMATMFDARVATTDELVQAMAAEG